MQKFFVFFLLSNFFLFNCAGTKQSVLYQSEELEIHALSKHTYRHVSFLQTQGFGKVGCNGMIFIKNGEAIIFDSPANDRASKALLAWLRKQKVNVRGIVPTHFHIDCVASLHFFRDEGIPSYGTQATHDLTRKSGMPMPLNLIQDRHEFVIGNTVVHTRFFGEGHTEDNIVAYVPSEKVLFGGCLIKSLNAGRGNLNDATLAEWAITVQQLKQAYPEVEYIIPGHGAPSDASLLDYTIEMFSKDAKN